MCNRDPRRLAGLNAGKSTGGYTTVNLPSPGSGSGNNRIRRFHRWPSPKIVFPISSSLTTRVASLLSNPPPFSRPTAVPSHLPCWWSGGAECEEIHARKTCE